MNTSSGPSLFDNTEPASSHRRTFINPTLWFDDCDGYRVVFCRHEVLYRVALGDPLHLALVAVTLRQSGLATQVEIAAAFGHAVASQRRWETRYRQQSRPGWPTHSGAVSQPQGPNAGDRPRRHDRGPHDGRRRRDSHRNHRTTGSG